MKFGASDALRAELACQTNETQSLIVDILRATAIKSAIWGAYLLNAGNFFFTSVERRN
jgi:hypothetical protein